MRDHKPPNSNHSPTSDRPRPSSPHPHAFPKPQHGTYNSYGPAHYKQKSIIIPSNVVTPPLPPFSPPTRRLRSHSPHTHTTAHCNMRDGGATRPPFDIPNSSAIHTHAHTNDAAICNTLYGGNTRPPHCIPHTRQHTRMGNDTNRPCSGTALRHAAQHPLRDPKTAPHTTSLKDPPTRRSTYTTTHRYNRLRPLDTCPKPGTPYPSQKQNRTLHTTP